MQWRTQTSEALAEVVSLLEVALREETMTSSWLRPAGEFLKLLRPFVRGSVVERKLCCRSRSMLLCQLSCLVPHTQMMRGGRQTTLPLTKRSACLYPAIVDFLLSLLASTEALIKVGDWIASVCTCALDSESPIAYRRVYV